MAVVLDMKRNKQMYMYMKITLCL